MALGEINKVEDLYEYLYASMQLEHATIPPYITALYTIKPNSNLEAYNVIRIVVVEEMLHLTLAANILNAIGGKPDLTKNGFVPEFPTYLPNGEDDFEVGIRNFSRDALDTFLQIERPAKQDQEKGVVKKLVKANNLQHKRLLPAYINKDNEEMHFYSIGEFYSFIGEGLKKLSKELEAKGENLFSGEFSRQITPEYYYSGGGNIIPVTNLESALSAIRLISEQGEGYDGGIFDNEGELSHFYRFEQLRLGRYYQPGDIAGNPSGEKLEINWDGAYKIVANPKMEDYPEGSELYEANVKFNTYYKNFLAKISDAFNGNPKNLMPAIGGMFVLKEMAYELIHNPIPGKESLFGAPTFEVDKVPVVA